MRQLYHAAQGRRKDEWGRMAQLIAEIRNIVRDPKKRSKPYTADELNPTIDRPPPIIQQGGFEALKAIATR